MKHTITRRDFMRQGACALASTSVALSVPAKAGAKRSKVVLVRRDDALDENFAPNEAVIGQMFDDAIRALTGVDDPVKGFKRFIKPKDIVGIKTNEWNYLPTPPALESVLKRRVLSVGVKQENLSMDDRGARKDPVFLKATALINVRPLRTHYLAGMSGCMKNYISFSENPSDYHPNNCENMARLFDLPIVKGKSRLQVLSVLTPQYHGRGPHHFNRRYVLAYKGLLVGADPVAVDAVGLQILTAIRKVHLKDNPQLAPMPRYIQVADAKHGLGNSDMKNIELIRLGSKEGVLI